VTKFRRRMWRVARAVGLPVSPRTFNGGTSPWDGDVLHGHVTARGEGDADWWHEIGHFLVAPEEGLRLRGWGQGMVYDGTDGGPELGNGGQEEDASAVGIWCQAVLGKDPEGAEVHARYHSWKRDERSWRGHLHKEMDPAIRDRVRDRLRAKGLQTPWTP
jgi:hypothetical protein